MECLNHLDQEAFSVKKGLENPDLLFLLEEAAVAFCLALHSACVAMKHVGCGELFYCCSCLVDLGLYRTYYRYSVSISK